MTIIKLPQLKQHYFIRPESFSLLQLSLYLTLALLFGCQTLFSQLTIPANNAYTTTSNRPVGAFYGHDRTASIYTSSEMGIASGSTITGVRYFVQTASAPATLPVSIYMKNVFNNSFTAGLYNSALIGSTTVHSSLLQGSSVTAGRWITFPLTTPFVYTGDNLQVLVATDIDSDPGQGTTDKTFRWSGTSSAQTQTWQSNIAATFPSNGTVSNSKPNIQILYNTPGAVGTLSWDYTALSLLENRTHTIAVNRSGGSTGAVSVNYATSDGTAIAGTDYTPTSGTLTWADGDMAPKTFTLTTLPDFILDDAETINITLSNPSGTTIAGSNQMVVSITDVLPPMTGTYTVGTGGNYPSLTNAGGIFQAINTRVDGVSGPLTINIISDLTGETGTIALNEIAGSHPVLIQPYGGPRTVSGSISNSIANLGLIRFEGTDNITINGSLAGGTVPSCQIGGDASLRQLTFINNTSANTVALLFQSSNSGAYNNTVKNVNVIGASPSTGYGIMFRVFPHSSSVPSLVNNQNCRVENCAIKKSGIGISSSGSTTSNPSTGLVIHQNDISATGTDRVSKYAVFISNETNPQVTFNKVNIMNTTTDSSETVGLGIGASQAYSPSVTSGGISGALVANNWITGVVSTVDLGGSTAGIAVSGTAFGTPNIIQNNMISNVSGLSQFNYHVAGIWVVGAVASETKLYYNTISLYGDRGARTNQSCSYGIAVSGLDPSVEMKNNVISTTQIATGGGLLKTYAFGTLSSTFDNLVSNNNVFYSGGVQDGGFRSGSLANNAGTSYATLAGWTAATGKDTNSVEVQPVFAAANDLHLVAGSNPTIEGIGTPIASVVTDFDCQPRNLTNPSPGADEVNVIGYTISASAGANGTISPAGTTTVFNNANQTYTITANCGYAISDVLVDGISQGAITSYTFANVSANHTISAVFSGNLPTIAASGATTFCQGGSVTLTSSATTGNIWSNGATTQSITVSTAGSYTVSVNNGSCTTAPSAATTVTVTPLPAAPTISASGATTFCQGGNVTLTSSATTGNLWSNGATTQSITVTASGTYTVSVNNGTCTSAASAATTVTVNPLPVTPTITPTGPTTFCQGGSVILISSAASGNVWSNGATTQFITVTSSGTYSVYVNNGICTSDASTAITVTVNPLPATPTISASGATTFCQGGSVTLTSSATTGNLWSTGATTQSITVTASGNYTVSVNNGSCTSAASAPTAIAVNPLPATPTISASGATTFCQGGSVTLTSSATTGNIWSNGATTQSITVTASGNYTVSVNNGSCTTAPSAATTVTVNLLPDAGVTQSGGIVTATQAGATYQWFTCANAAIDNETGQTFTPTVIGDYYVQVSNGNCTVTSACISVSQLDNPAFARNLFRIYPNPVSEVLHIEYTDVLTQVEVFNMVGQKLISGKAGAASAQIDMSHLPAGTFVVKVSSDATSESFKVIKK